METLLQLIITPVIILASSKILKGIQVSDIRSSFIASSLIIIVGFLIGWILTFIINILTLGIFWMIGLGILTRTFAYAIIIEIVSQFRPDFGTRGFLPSLWLSAILAVAWTLIESLVV